MRTITIAIVSATLAACGTAAASHDTPLAGHTGNNGSYRITGCPSEDSCAIDYRADALGHPVWVIRQVHP